MKVGNINWKSKSLRSSTNNVNQSQLLPQSIKNRIHTLPGRARVSKSFHTQLSNPNSSPKRQSEFNSSTNNAVSNMPANKPEDVSIHLLFCRAVIVR